MKGNIHTSKIGRLYESKATGILYRVFKWRDLGEGDIEAINKIPLRPKNLSESDAVFIEKLYLDDGSVPREIVDFFGKKTIDLLLETIDNLQPKETLWAEYQKRVKEEHSRISGVLAKWQATPPKKVCNRKT